MPPKSNRVATDSDWLKILLEGQLTRDPILRNATEIERDRNRAQKMSELRNRLFFKKTESDSAKSSK